MTAADRRHAFVVQFDSDGRSAGRAEHVSSGRRVRFESVEELVRFLTATGSDGTAGRSAPAARSQTERHHDE